MEWKITDQSHISREERGSISDHMEGKKERTRRMWRQSWRPSRTLTYSFWKLNKDRCPLLSHLAKNRLTACATSVPSESVFSVSAFVARKERAHLSGQNLAYTFFWKTKSCWTAKCFHSEKLIQNFIFIRRYYRLFLCRRLLFVELVHCSLSFRFILSLDQLFYDANRS